MVESPVQTLGFGGRQLGDDPHLLMDSNCSSTDRGNLRGNLNLNAFLRYHDASLSVQFGRIKILDSRPHLSRQAQA